MKHSPASFLLGLTLSATAVAADTGGAPGTAPAGSNGSSQGVSPTGFDVSGSHPLPNGGEQEAPGRGACGCRLTSADSVLARGAEQAALVAVLAVALAALRRRNVA
jgi:hypothetical protein